MLDLRHDGIRMAAVLPGLVVHASWPTRRPPTASWMLAPEDVAEAVADLVRSGPGHPLAHRPAPVEAARKS